MVDKYHDDRYSEESQFNMAMAYLQRIDKLLYLCQQAALVQNIDLWLNYLRALYRELSVKLNPKKKDKEKFSETQELINGFIVINKLVGDQAMKRSNKSKILSLLDAIEIKMRCKLQEKGMLLPSKTDQEGLI